MRDAGKPMGARWAVLAVALSAPLIAGCGGDTPREETRQRNEAATEVPVAALQWQACARRFSDWTPPATQEQAQAEANYDCAILQVPMDYLDTSGKTLDLALRRRPADGPGAKIGSIVIEPGGPGGSGVDAVGKFADSLSPEVRARFDIVGFDPRGVGLTRPTQARAGSPALPCGGDLARYFAGDLADTRAANTRLLDEAARTYAQSCAQDEILPLMGTMNVARDVEVLRRALRDDKLTYLGVSYGTEVGIVYADLYPTHVRAMIIDGVVNPAQSGTDILVQQAQSWNEGLTHFFDWCRVQARAACGIRDDPEGRFRAMLDKARLEAPSFAYDGALLPLSTGWLTLTAVLSIYEGSAEGYAGLAHGIQEALRTPANWAPLRAGVQALAQSKSLGPSVWTTCMDQPLPKGEAYEAIVARAVAAAPLTGAVQANINRPCAHLPVPPDPVPTTYQATGSPPIMVWGTRHDPATPYAASVAVVQQLANASLFTFNAKQHVAMGGGPNRKACVVDVQSDYLLSARLVPQRGDCEGD